MMGFPDTFYPSFCLFESISQFHVFSYFFLASVRMKNIFQLLFMFVCSPTRTCLLINIGLHKLYFLQTLQLFTILCHQLCFLSVLPAFYAAEKCLANKANYDVSLYLFLTIKPDVGYLTECKSIIAHTNR